MCEGLPHEEGITEHKQNDHACSTGVKCPSDQGCSFHLMGGGEGEEGKGRRGRGEGRGGGEGEEKGRRRRGGGRITLNMLQVARCSRSHGHKT